MKREEEQNEKPVAGGEKWRRTDGKKRSKKERDNDGERRRKILDSGGK